MNWREGFARLARATAVVYWLIVGVSIVFWTWDAMRDYYPGATPYDSGSYRWDWSNTQDAAPQIAATLFWCALAYFALMFAFRGLRWIARGFATSPPAQ